MPASWPLAALEAQAVASRTYALTDHAGGARFDVYADTRSQVYLGAKAHTAQTNAAVAATAGQVVTYAGQPAITYFFASSGGMTESVQNGFPGATPEPWLRGVPDPYDQGPQHSWSVSMSFAAAAARLRGLVRGAFRGIEVLRRGYSPRIVSRVRAGLGRPHAGERPRTGGPPGLDDSWAYFSVRTARGVSPSRTSATTPRPRERPRSHRPPGSTRRRTDSPGSPPTGASPRRRARRRHDRRQRPERGRRRRHDTAVGWPRRRRRGTPARTAPRCRAGRRCAIATAPPSRSARIRSTHCPPHC